LPDHSSPTVLTSLEQSLSGRYTFERELGRGATSVVLLVRDEKHDRRVALKILKPEVAEAVGADRFQREIRTAARLQHPHIATVYDSGNDDGVLWFSMPYVESGSTLREYITRAAPFSIDEARRLARELGQALQYAHDHGVLHRDVKPENVLLTEDGSTLITDFGLAQDVADPDERLTETGIALGTPAYMSPEQVRGAADLDARSDQYSLACTIFELLAGERPFEGGKGLAFVARRLVEAVPDIRTKRPDVSDDMALALQRAMAIDPDERFDSVRSFVGAFTGLQSSGATVVTPIRGLVGVTPATSPSRSLLPMRRLWIGAVSLVATLTVVWGVMRAGRRSTEGANAPVAQVALAVLPFEAGTDSATAYFAEGLTSEVRTRLSSLSELRVMASASSNQYRGNTGSLADVGRELGVAYLLTGKVLASIDSTGTRRLRVSPELVDVRTNSSVWSSSYQASLTDVFAVQGDIAQRVASAMGVALGSSSKAALTSLPTRSMAAYDAFLRAEAVSQQRSVRDPPTLRRALTAYLDAARLDSTFLLAWARGVNVGSTLWFNRPPDAALKDTLRMMVERALRIDPRSPATFSAVGDYQLLVGQNSEQAIAALEQGLRAAPDDPALLGSISTANRTVGRWAESREQLERLVVLDPRSTSAWNSLGRTRLWTRDYPAARAAYTRALELTPGSLGARQNMAMVWLAQGRLDSAQAVIRATPKTVSREALVAFFGTYWDLAWALDDADQRLLLTLLPDAFDGDVGNWGLVLAQAHHVRGNVERAKVYADSAQRAILARRDQAPDDWQQLLLRGLALAYAGRKAEAIEEGERAVALRPLARDANFGAYALFTMARIYALVGETEKAKVALEKVLAVPMYASRAWVSLDPAFKGITLQ
jgi:eukaryotic-like serine/threonine-protein kinase